MFYMKVIILVFIALILFGCTSGYKKFYHQNVDARISPDVELLQPGQEPKVFRTDNFENDIKALQEKHYIVIGYSSFNGSLEDTKNAAAQAKVIGATIVLTNSEYTDTQTTNSAIIIPNTQTTYYGDTVVPFTTHQRRFDQNAVYLVRSTKKFRYGISIADLNTEKRAEIERNTGVLIDMVFEDTPAFYSNVIAGDILISVDGQNIINVEHAEDILKYSGNSEYSILKVIRKGNEKEIKVEF